MLEEFGRTRDPRLREELIYRLMPLAKSLAMRYAGGREPTEDLFQVASFGLIKAIDRFDPSREVSFSSFAVPTILGELRRHFRDCASSIHLPRGTQERVLDVERATQSLGGELGRPPTPEELAAELRISEAEVLDALEAAQARRPKSLDLPQGSEEDDRVTLGESIGFEDRGYETVEASVACANADLSDREQAVLRLRFGRGLTQSEIGKMLGVSQMQISRISRRATKKLLAEVQAEPEPEPAGSMSAA